LDENSGTFPGNLQGYLAWVHPIYSQAKYRTKGNEQFGESFQNYILRGEIL